MSDHFVYACAECNNAVVAFDVAPPDHDCPACGAENGEGVHEIWKMGGQIR